MRRSPSENKIVAFALEPSSKREETKIKNLVKGDLIVLIAFGINCPIFRKYIPTINALNKKYSKKGVTFLLVNAVKNSKNLEINKMIKEFEVALPVYQDSSMQLLKSLAFSTLSEVAFIRLSTNEILYKGAINNQMTFDFTRNTATNNYLIDAMESEFNKKEIKVKSALAFGCAITY